MNPGPFSTERIRRIFLRIDEHAERSTRFQQIMAWLLLVLGLTVWTAAQTALVALPLWSRVLPFELDDILPYLLRTQQVEECPLQNCPALNDLREQILVPSPDPEVARERAYAANPFPHYHPLLSLILLGMKRAGLDLVTGYKVLWTLGPFFFGLGFAYLLSSLFGRAAAGLALVLLAAKVFPSAGVHYVVPSSLSMGMAMFLWARVIATRGDCPWTMPIGSVAVVAMHPVGLVYVVTAAVIALSAAGIHRKSAAWKPILITAGLFLAAFLAAVIARIPALVVPVEIIPTGSEALLRLLKRGIESYSVALVPEILRLEGGLVGSVAFFCGWTALGFFTLQRDTRALVLRFLVFYLPVLLASLFHVQFDPGDLFFRIWIPLVIILFGVVAAGFCFLVRETWNLAAMGLKAPSGSDGLSVRDAWPAVLMVMFLGYAFSMIARGGEQLLATSDRLRNRQPLALYEEQPRLLVSMAKPGDRVLYTSFIIMPYYFMHGAMQLGAVYYHPALLRTKETNQWLDRPDLRFAVTYNPTFYRPFSEGRSEKDCILNPQFYFSPLSDPPRYGPLSREGSLFASDFKWIELTPHEGRFPEKLKILLQNPGSGPATIIVASLRLGKTIPDNLVHSHMVPPNWSGWMEFPLERGEGVGSVRVILPQVRNRLSIHGMAFDDEKTYWPWAAKTDMTFLSKNPLIGKITVSFDPSRHMPPQLRGKRLVVENDRGSSVLFRIE